MKSNTKSNIVATAAVAATMLTQSANAWVPMPPNTNTTHDYNMSQNNTLLACGGLFVIITSFIFVCANYEKLKTCCGLFRESNNNTPLPIATTPLASYMGNVV